MIAGIFFGFAFGIGGIAAAVLGRLADVRGIEFVFWLGSYPAAARAADDLPAGHEGAGRLTTRRAIFRLVRRRSLRSGRSTRLRRRAGPRGTPSSHPKLRHGLPVTAVHRGGRVWTVP